MKDITLPGQPKYITDLPDGTKNIDFTGMGLKLDGTEVNQMIMREPRVGDQLAVDGIASIAKREATMLANLCEVSPDQIEAMTMRQYGRLQDGYTAFMV
jgi:hypothetical protein